MPLTCSFPQACRLQEDLGWLASSGRPSAASMASWAVLACWPGRRGRRGCCACRSRRLRLRVGGANYPARLGLPRSISSWIMACSELPCAPGATGQRRPSIVPLGRTTLRAWGYPHHAARTGAQTANYPARLGLPGSGGGYEVGGRELPCAPGATPKRH